MTASVLSSSAALIRTWTTSHSATCVSAFFLRPMSFCGLAMLIQAMIHALTQPHSEVPTKVEDWPTLEEILAYKEKVIERVRKIYADIANGQRTLDRRLARMLWMTLEHKGEFCFFVHA